MEPPEDYLDWIDGSVGWLPDWAVSAIAIALGLALGWLLHRIVWRQLGRVAAGRGQLSRSLLARTEGPARLAFVLLGVVLAAGLAPLEGAGATLIRHVLQVCLVVLVGWAAGTVVEVWTAVHLRRFDLGSEDALLARKHVTQTRILRRTAQTLIVIVTIGAALMTFEGVRQYGVSLLASAGAAGIVVGLALQPLLKNLIAGVQLAITQPIRIDDALIVEDEWGTVEEITSTYVVLRLWDLRRLILPLNHFIEKPFENWTRETTSLIGSVFLYADYRTPVAALRDKLREIAEASPLWDGQVAALQVTDLTEQTMQLRLLVSARDAGQTFDLRCEVREKMVAWLQAEHPGTLPRIRQENIRPPDRERDATAATEPVRPMARRG